MLVIRPVTPDDLGSLAALADLAGFGLTGLPRDPELLKERISEARYGFARETAKPGGEVYLFVMEDVLTGKVVGTSAIVSKVGGFEPFYAYRIESSVQESKILGVHKEIRLLRLVATHSGPCEIGGLFLAPSFRLHGNGRLMSLCRFLFMAENPRRFDPTVIAEMRGVCDESGRSPFWEAVGRHFFDIDFPRADYLTMKNKHFIAELMPVHPLYVSLLPGEAREVIGRVHEQSHPALSILEEEGFVESGMVDIFDAGPVVSCPLAEIRTVRSSAKAPVDKIDSDGMGPPSSLIGTTKKEFRACAGSVKVAPDGGLRITADTARALLVKAGDFVRHAPLYPAVRRTAACEGSTGSPDESSEGTLHPPSVA